MFALLANIRVDPARAAPFEKLFGDYARQVLAEEPGSVTYCLAKSRAEEGSYRAIEIYRSEALFREHVASDGFRAFRAEFATFLLQPPISERLDIVA